MILLVIAAVVILAMVIIAIEEVQEIAKEEPSAGSRRDETGRLLSSGVSWSREDKLKAAKIVHNLLKTHHGVLPMTLKQLGDQHVKDFKGRTRDSLASAFSRYRGIIIGKTTDYLPDEEWLLEQINAKTTTKSISKRKVKVYKVSDSPTRPERVGDKEFLKKHFAGEFITGSKKIDLGTYPYMVMITETGFKTESHQLFQNPQAAVNQDVLNNGIPKNRKKGLTFWTQGKINGESIDNAIANKQAELKAKESIFYQPPVKDESMDKLIKGLNRDAKRVLRNAVSNGGAGHISGKLAKKIVRPEKVFDLIKAKNLIKGPQPGKSRANLSFQLRPEVQRYLNVNGKLLK